MVILRWRRPVATIGVVAVLGSALVVAARWGGAVTGRVLAGLPDAGPVTAWFALLWAAADVAMLVFTMSYWRLPAPPPLTASTVFRPPLLDAFFLIVVLVGAGAYLAGIAWAFGEAPAVVILVLLVARYNDFLRRAASDRP
jgi:hypothetical protein